MEFQEHSPFQERKRMTRLGEALAKRLIALKKPVVSNYEIFRQIWLIHEEGKTKYLRENRPSRDTFQRTRKLLKDEGVIFQDADYSRLWRVLANSDAPADEIVCVVDPDCYISHLSAMQRYGLTDRRPEALFITVASAKVVQTRIKRQIESDYGANSDPDPDPNLDIEPLYRVGHPNRVRGRLIDAHSTTYFGDWRQIRGSFARVASIGQTFLDMLDEPKRCGGMLHVLKIWEDNAPVYLEEIIDRVDESSKNILKVRAGFILSEKFGINDPRILGWKKFAQRGGSQVLEAGKPYVDRHSEEWMLSINVG